MVTVIPSTTSAAFTAPSYTWYIKISDRVEFFSSVSYVVRSIPAAANAASVGANTVNGPFALNASTNPAWLSAATRESWTPVFAALVGMSWFSSATTIGERARLAVISTAIITFELYMGRGLHNPLLYGCF